MIPGLIPGLVPRLVPGLVIAALVLSGWFVHRTLTCCPVCGGSLGGASGCGRTGCPGDWNGDENV